MKRTLRNFSALLLCLPSVVIAAGPVNDECSGASRLIFTSSQDCNTGSNFSETVTGSGNNTEATPVANGFPVFGTCNSGPGTLVANEVWFKYTSPGIENKITISSGSLNRIQVVAFRGGDCDNLIPIQCDVGSGSVTVSLSSVPGTDITFFVSGQDVNDFGSFNYSVTSSSKCTDCYTPDEGNLIISPANPTGIYGNGEQVTVCFQLSEWNGNALSTDEWIHSLVFELGSGWDAGTVNPITLPTACRSGNSWQYFPNGWTGCRTGITFPRGFAVERGSNDADPCGSNPNDPGDNYGDGGNACSQQFGLEWCWEMRVSDNGVCVNGEIDLSISVTLYSDGDAGSWTETGCNSGAEFNVIGTAVCCDDLDPLLSVTNQNCPTIDDGTLTVDPNGATDPGGTYRIRIDRAGTFIGEFVNTGSFRLEDLAPGTYTVQTINLASGCSRSSVVDILPGNPAAALAEFSEVCPGEGPVQLTGSTTTPGSSFDYAWTGPNGFTASGASAFTDDPADVGLYELIVTVDGCPSEPAAVNVRYRVFDPIASGPPDVVCFGGDAALTVSNLPAGTAVEWYDPDGNVLPGNDETITVTTSASGTQIYRVFVAGTNCSRLLDVPVQVAEQLQTELVTDPANGQVCIGNDVVFTARMPGGGQFPAGWTFSWGGMPATGSAVYTPENYVLGPNQVDLVIGNPAGCSQPFTAVYTVVTPPEVALDPAAYTVCGAGTVVLDPDVTGGQAPYTYLWGPNESDDITTPTLSVNANSMETEAIYVFVTDANNCRSFSNLADVEIVPDLLAVAFDGCNTATAGEITFGWNDVGQDRFEVYLSVNGGTETTVNDYNPTTYTATGLSGGDAVTIRVVPVGGTGSQKCLGPENIQTCTAVSCADPAFTLDLAGACTDAQDLVVTLDGPFVAGTNYTLTVSDGAFVTDADFSDGAGGISVVAAGTSTIGLATENPAAPDCDASATATFTLHQPVPTPTPTCGNSDLNSLEINWNDVGADSYVVNVVSAPAGATTSEAGTAFIATGLNAGESVTISITALVAGCPAVTSQAITCIAQSCADITPVITTPSETLCGDGSAGPVDLTVDVPGAGAVEWSGPGVTGAQFDPVAAGPGTHTVTVVYTEGTCTYPASFERSVEAPLTGLAVAVSDDDVCPGTPVTFTLNGVVPADRDVLWALPAGAVLVGGNLATVDPIAVDFAVGSNEVKVAVSGGVCADSELMAAATVRTPGAATTGDCENISFDRVGFGWDNPDGLATSYVVTDIPTGAVLTDNGNSVLVTGLAEGESVTIAVSTMSGNVCPDPAGLVLTCTAASCPDVTVALDPVGPFCFGEDATVALHTNTASVDNNGTLTYLPAPGVVGADFVSTGLAVNDYRVIASYTEVGCTFNDTLLVAVTALPVATIGLTAGPVCRNETVGAAAGAVEVGWSYGWDFGADASPPTATGAGPVDVAWSSPGTKTVTLVPTDAAGCVGAPVTTTIEVFEPLGVPTIGCGVPSLTSIEFGWDPIAGATGYAVSIDGGPAATQDSTGLFIDGLDQGDLVSIRVTALGEGPCGNGPTSASRQCEAGGCPTIVVTPPLDRNFCTGGPANVLELTATQSGGFGNGTYIFTGPGVTESGGVYTFDADLAGPGTQQIDVVYNETICTGAASFTMTVTETPEGRIALNGFPEPLVVCEGEEFSIGYRSDSGNLLDDSVRFVWDFVGANVAVPEPFVDNAYTAGFSVSGLYKITAMVAQNGCVNDTITQTVTVQAPLDPLVISCGGTTLNSVTFAWNDVEGATGYELADGTILPAGTTGYTLNGMLAGRDTTISLTPLSAAACANGATVSSPLCTTNDCPALDLDTDNLQTQTCLENGNETIDLSTVLVTGGTGNGTYVFSGPGVTGTTFDAAVAGGDGAGRVHAVTVDYEEDLCTFSGLFEVTVFERPASDFGVSESVVCTNTETTVSLSGTVDPAATYTWDFAGAAQTAGADPESYNLSWPTAGTYTIRFAALANGCQTLASLDVTVDPPAKAGDVVVTDEALCAANASAIDLNGFLNGQDAGGVWSVTPGSPGNVGDVDISTGRFNAGALGAGEYLFVYSVRRGSCLATSSEVRLRLLPPPVAEAGEERRLTCTTGMARLDGSASDAGEGVTYRWFSNDPDVPITGANQPTLDVGQPGTYFLEVTNAIGCSAADEVIVTAETEAPVMEVDVSNISCFAADDGAILVTGVSGGRAPYTYTLSGEERGAATLFSGLTAQEYNLQVTDANGCFSNLLLDLTEPDELTVRLAFPGDTTFADAGDEVTIVANVNGGNALDTLMWMPDSLTGGESRNAITFLAAQTQLISLTVVDELGCRTTEREMLLVRKDRPVYFPNAFSPNDDNINDVWFIGGDLDQIEFIDDFFVFDRWGEAVHTGGQLSADGLSVTTGNGARFLPNDPAFGWDGTLNGKTMAPQVLVYTATVHFTDGEVVVYKGDFVLMR